MEILILLVLCATVFHYVSSSAPRARPEAPREQSLTASAPGRTRFLSPIPKGYQIFVDRLQIAGVGYRKQEALRFAAAEAQSLRFERERTNLYDANAIKVIGITASGEHVLGYLPKDIAEQFAKTGLFDSLKPRLSSVFVSEGEFVDIEFQVIGPKSQKPRFDDCSTGAESGISGHEASVDEEKAEWTAYLSILDQFEDADFLDDFDLRKVSRTTLSKALVSLKKAGKNYRYLEENIEEVVDAILESKPRLERVA